MFTACAAQRESDEDGDFQIDDSAIVVVPTSTPTVTCASATATLVAQNLVNNSVAANASLLWKVVGLGCSRFQMIRPNQAPAEFASEIYYSTSYRFPVNGLIEVVTIRALSSTGATVREWTVTSAPFNVTSGGTPPGVDPLTCAVGGPYSVTVPVNAAGYPIGNFPTVPMAITSNRASRVLSMTVLAGAAYASSGVPDTTANGIHSPQVVPYAPGANLVRFELADATNPLVRATCSGTISLSGVYTPPSACQLVANRYSVSPGGSVTFTLSTTSGSAFAGAIDGVSVSPFGGTRTITFSSSRTVFAAVGGYNGTSYCEAYITVTQDQVGINFEDFVDSDYNDAVLCMTGFLQVLGKQIVSHAAQTIYARRTRISACDSNVLLRIYNGSGGLEQTIAYTSSLVNGSSIAINLQSGWKIDSRFTPLGTCAATGAQEQQSSSRIAVGNYCNVTGN